MEHLRQALNTPSVHADLKAWVADEISAIQKWLEHAQTFEEVKLRQGQLMVLRKLDNLRDSLNNASKQ